MYNKQLMSETLYCYIKYSFYNMILYFVMISILYKCYLSMKMLYNFKNS